MSRGLNQEQQLRNSLDQWWNSDNCKHAKSLDSRYALLQGNNGSSFWVTYFEGGYYYLNAGGAHKPILRNNRFGSLEVRQIELMLQSQDFLEDHRAIQENIAYFNQLPEGQFAGEGFLVSKTAYYTDISLSTSSGERYQVLLDNDGTVRSDQVGGISERRNFLNRAKVLIKGHQRNLKNEIIPILTKLNGSLIEDEPYSNFSEKTLITIGQEGVWVSGRQGEAFQRLSVRYNPKKEPIEILNPHFLTDAHLRLVSEAAQEAKDRLIKRISEKFATLEADSGQNFHHLKFLSNGEAGYCLGKANGNDLVIRKEGVSFNILQYSRDIPCVIKSATNISNLGGSGLKFIDERLSERLEEKSRSGDSNSVAAGVRKFNQELPESNFQIQRQVGVNVGVNYLQGFEIEGLSQNNRAQKFKVTKDYAAKTVTVKGTEGYFKGADATYDSNTMRLMGCSLAYEELRRGFMIDAMQALEATLQKDRATKSTVPMQDLELLCRGDSIRITHGNFKESYHISKNENGDGGFKIGIIKDGGKTSVSLDSRGVATKMKGVAINLEELQKLIAKEAVEKRAKVDEMQKKSGTKTVVLEALSEVVGQNQIDKNKLDRALNKVKKSEAKTPEERVMQLWFNPKTRLTKLDKVSLLRSSLGGGFCKVEDVRTFSEVREVEKLPTEQFKLLAKFIESWQEEARGRVDLSESIQNIEARAKEVHKKGGQIDRATSEVESEAKKKPSPEVSVIAFERLGKAMGRGSVASAG